MTDHISLGSAPAILPAYQRFTDIKYLSRINYLPIIMPVDFFAFLTARAAVSLVTAMLTIAIVGICIKIAAIRLIWRLSG